MNATIAAAAAMAAPPTSVELKARDAANWGLAKPPQAWEPAASPPVLPQAPDALDFDAHLRAALGTGVDMDKPLPRALSALGEHVEALRTVAEHHGNAHLAIDHALHESVGTLRAFRDADAQKITALELERERLAKQNAALVERVAAAEARVAELASALESYMGQLLDLREADGARLDALEARKPTSRRSTGAAG